MTEEVSENDGNIFTRWFKNKQPETVRETIEDLIEEICNLLLYQRYGMRQILFSVGSQQ